MTVFIELKMKPKNDSTDVSSKNAITQALSVDKATRHLVFTRQYVNVLDLKSIRYAMAEFPDNFPGGDYKTCPSVT